MKGYRHIFVLLAILLALGSSALASGPYQSHVHLQGNGGDIWVCDSNGNLNVDAEDVHIQGRFWFNVYEVTEYDETGNVLQITWTSTFHGVVTNLSTGELVAQDRFGGREVVDFTSSTYAQLGATRHLFRSGEGTLYHDAGRFMIDISTGEIIEETGLHSLRHSGLTSFCQLIDGAGNEILWEPQPTDIKVLGP